MLPTSSPSLSLAVDANVVLSMVTNVPGQQLLRNRAFRLVMSAYTFDEFTEHLERVLQKKVASGRLAQAQADVQLAESVTFAVGVLERSPLTVYEMHEDEARDRVPGDPDDWHTVALALAFGAEIWTNDKHFLGCGVPVWTTETLRRRLAKMNV